VFPSNIAVAGIDSLIASQSSRNDGAKVLSSVEKECSKNAVVVQQSKDVAIPSKSSPGRVAIVKT